MHERSWMRGSTRSMSKQQHRRDVFFLKKNKKIKLFIYTVQTIFETNVKKRNKNVQYRHCGTH